MQHIRGGALPSFKLELPSDIHSYWRFSPGSIFEPAVRAFWCVLPPLDPL